MHFITCFDQNWYENQRRFFGEVPCPRDEAGRALYLEEHHRTFGYFSDKERALAAVHRNECDIHECLYTWCVVEYLPEGIHALGADLDEVGANESWFQWSIAEKKWTTAQRPTALAQCCGGFAMG